jgi:DNA invertase Pin-like site-specific DNA recombinase
MGGSAFTADLGEVARDDPDDPMRTALRQMIGVVAQLERGMIAARLRAGRRAKAEVGGYAYGAPRYGLRAEDGVLVADAAEQRAIARARELREDGASLREIAATLVEAEYAAGARSFTVRPHRTLELAPRSHVCVRAQTR